MTATFLVTGGTGTVGSLVVPRLRDAGCRVRVLSRRAHEPADGVEYTVGDLHTGEGIDAAVAGVETIVHCAGSAKGDEQKTRHLVRAATRAGNPHVVNISVVGAERVPVESGVDRAMFGYFAAKRATEEVVAGSGLPWTNLRATQFHDLILMVARMLTRSPVVPVFAGFRFQPVDAGEVADRLTELALDKPAGTVPDFGGPRAYPMADLMRGYLRASHRRRALLSVPVPGGAARAIRGGANLPVDGQLGHRTWEDFLAQRV
jgi:uncharacterized protein YbjT (DUF2867 family)